MIDGGGKLMVVAICRRSRENALSTGKVIIDLARFYYRNSYIIIAKGKILVTHN